jgi:predicted ATPase
MLNKLSIQNFKAFGEPASEFKLSPLTILVGPNGSGKTAVLEALGLLAQTAAEGYNQHGFKWRGKWVDFEPNGKSVFHDGDSEKEMAFSVGASNLGLQFPEDSSDKGELISLEYSVCHKPKENYWQHVCTLSDGGRAINTYQPGPNQGPKLEFEKAGITGIYGPLASGTAIFSSQLFQISSVIRSSPDSNFQDVQRKTERFHHGMSRLTNVISQGIYLLGPNRAPKRVLPDLQKYGLSVGRSGEDTFNLLSHLFASPEYDDAMEKIKSWANIFGLPKLKAGWARQLELQAGFSDPLTGTPLFLEGSGYGSQQVLPVLTQVFAAPKGSTILIEEPEISLHPAAQVDLVRLFGDAIAYGQQIILTTHSQILPLALSELQAYSIKPDDISIYHLTRSRDSVVVQSLQVDERWSVPGWIPSFSQVDSKLLKTWISKVHDDIRG